MIVDKILHRIRGQTTLTLDDPTGWGTGGSTLFGGKEMQAMKLPAVNACIEIISDSVAKMPLPEKPPLLIATRLYTRVTMESGT